MARRAAGRKEHHIHSHVAAGLYGGRPADFGGSGYAGQAAFADGKVEFGDGCACLHFDESDYRAGAGHQIDPVQGVRARRGKILQPFRRNHRAQMRLAGRPSFSACKWAEAVRFIPSRFL
jgi:hypothetical protein